MPLLVKWSPVFILLDIAERLELVLTVSPIRLHFHKKLKIDTLPEELLNIFTGFHTHFFDHRTLMAYDDTLLRITLHIDHCHNMDGILLLLELLYNHLY